MGRETLVITGAPERIRTSGLRIRSPLLYPAELQARCFIHFIIFSARCNPLQVNFNAGNRRYKQSTSSRGKPLPGCLFLFAIFCYTIIRNLLKEVNLDGKDRHDLGAD